MARSPWARPSTEERAAVLVGDDVVTPADVVMDRAFTVEASPETVWPWLVQLGKGRAGWYLPAPVERIVPRSRRGIRHLDPRFLGLAVGDVVPDWGGADATFTVVSIEPPTHLLYGSTRGRAVLTWGLFLSEAPGGATRVHLRLRLAQVRHRILAKSAGGLLDLVTVMGLAAGLRERLRQP
jgi:hypothetical protein